MSKQSEAKESQGYVAKAVQSTCCNCQKFQSEKAVRRGYFGGTYAVEKNLRCGIGGFAVKKMGTCNEFTPKKQTEKT